jgi:hypothetical protein
VTKTTRTARKESRRDEKVAVLTEASVAIQELTREIDRAGSPNDVAVRVQRVSKMVDGPMKLLGDKSAVAATKLTLYGFDAAAEQVETLNDTLQVSWDSLCARTLLLHRVSTTTTRPTTGLKPLFMRL